jgi:integrase
MRRKNVRRRQQWGLPWFREFDGWWYITIGGQRRKLVKGNPGDPDNNREAALDEWRRVKSITDAGQKKDASPVWVILEKFLDRTQREHPRAYERYLPVCQSFKDMYPDLLVRELKACHVNEWMQSKPWNESTQSIASSVILAALNWAAKPEQELLDRNPIRGMKRPAIRSRGGDAVMEDGDFQTLFDNAPPWIQDALFFLRQTGTRPVNLARIEARGIDAANRCVRIEEHKTRAKTGRQLVIPLTQAALALLLRLAERYPDGPLFRNRQGKPLDGERFKTAFKTVKEKLERKGIALKGTAIAYGIRHAFATNLLKKDVPEAKVAFAMGHSDGRMLHKHYSHLDRESRSIASELDRAINGDAGGPEAPEA